MARKLADECMFCGSSPCECNQPVKAVRDSKVKSRPARNAAAVAVNTSAKEAMKASATEAESQLDEFVPAIRVLSDVLHPVEKRTYADILVNPEVRARATQWRERRRNA